MKKKQSIPKHGDGLRDAAADYYNNYCSGARTTALPNCVRSTKRNGKKAMDPS